MKLLLISLALVLIAHIEANKFDYVRNYLAKHDKSSKPVYKRSAQSWLKNSNTIGLGYNPLHGSPVCYTGACQGDGFQHAIFKLNYVQPAVGSCTNELVPDFVELQCIPSSDLQTSTEMISTSKHLYESTMKRIEFYVAERYRRFAASYFYSKETRSMIDEIYRQNSTAMYTRGEVTFGKLRMFEPFMELADTFRYVIEQMPCCNEFSQETYDYIKEFVIDYFGLSYVTELILGGIAQETMFVGNKEMQELNMRSEEVIRAASIGFLLNFNVQPIPPYNNVQQTQFMQTVQSRRSTKLGGDPSAQTMDDWIRSVPANPVIMNYGVKDISTLLTTKHFASDIHIHNKSKLIDMAILRYLEKHEPVCINDCTDSAHGICDVTNEPPFQLGTCVCRPGWTGYDCSKKDEPYYPRTTNAPYVPSIPTWDVERSDGVGESSRLNILNSLRTLIDRFGKEKKREIAMDLKLWLDKSYTGEWGVTLGGTDCYGSAFSAVANTYLVVNERAWGWRILIWRSS